LRDNHRPGPREHVDVGIHADLEGAIGISHRVGAETLTGSGEGNALTGNKPRTALREAMGSAGRTNQRQV